MSEHTDKTIQEKREHLRSLVLALYRVTDTIPESEPSRWKMREEALNTVSRAEAFFHAPSDMQISNLWSSLNTLQAYFEIAKESEWIDERNFIVLDREFERFGQSIDQSRQGFVGMDKKSHTVQTPKRPAKKKVTALTVKLSGRQEKIVDHLKQNGKVHVGDLSPLFPTLSKRTIRRDLDSLVKEHFVTRFGKTNGTLYSLVRT